MTVQTGAPPRPSPGGPAGARAELAKLTHNKPLLIAAAAAAGLGVWAFVKKRKAASSSTDTAGIADGSSLAGTPGNPAELNSVGTDVATQLGQFGAASAADAAAAQKAQSDALAAFLANLTTTATAGATIPTQAPATATLTPTPAAAQPASRSYTVVSGDNLTKIASKFGTTVSKIYSANSALIESNAKAHGYANSQNGHWIFPKEVFVIPG